MVSYLVQCHAIRSTTNIGSWWRLVSMEMPDKRLMYKSSVVDYTLGDHQDGIESVVVVEAWGKSNRKVRERVLESKSKGKEKSGGFTFSTHGHIVHDGEVYEVKESSDNEFWWLEHIEWGEEPQKVAENTEVESSAMSQLVR